LPASSCAVDLLRTVADHVQFGQDLSTALERCALGHTHRDDVEHAIDPRRKDQHVVDSVSGGMSYNSMRGEQFEMRANSAICDASNSDAWSTDAGWAR
jgi:hypothetical protein